MKLTPLAPALPRQQPDRRWSLAVSVALHALLLVAALALVIPRQPPNGSAAPSYDLVFDGPSNGTPTVDPNAIKTEALPPAQPADIPPPPDAPAGMPAPTPLTTPDPAATGSPPPAAESAPPPTPAPTPPAAAVPTAPAPAAPASAAPPPVAMAPPDEMASIPLPTPTEAPPSAEPPAVRLEMPPSEAAPTEAQPIMPQPPPPLPQVEPPRPRPVARPTPRPSLGTLANPMDLNLTPSAPRPAARGSVASRAIDLSPPAERQGPVPSDAYAEIRAANASADWNRGLLQYWLRHRYYPDQAAADGEEGSVTLKLTVNRSGKVESVEIVSRSGSQWLDMAALGTWRGAQLPPFTNEMREDRITFPIPIHYYLIRR